MISFRKDGDRVHITFTGECFFDILDACKHAYLVYEKESKTWSGSFRQIYNLIPELQEIEPISISDEILQAIQPKISVKFVRRKLIPNLIKLPPLAPYQLEDAQKMLYAEAIINGSDTGLGKTFETITALNHIFESKEIDKLLIVTFAQACYNWKRELLMFSTFVTEEEIVLPNLENRNPFSKEPKVIICSYGMFVLIEKYFHGQNSNTKLTKHTRKSSIPFDCWGANRGIVLDEAHAIKNRSALRTKSVFRHREFFKIKYLLSATPYPNGVEELYTLLNYLDEGIIYAEYPQFVRRIAEVGTKFDPNGIKTTREGKKIYKPIELELFLDSIKPFIFRRFGEKKITQHIKKIYVEMNEQQKDIYQSIISEKLEAIQKEQGFISTKDVVNSFPYLTLACSDPSVLSGKLISKTKFLLSQTLESKLKRWSFKQNSKLEACDDIITENIGENKIIIWSTHPATINLLGQHYEKYSPITIHGSSHNETKESKEDFRERLLNEFKIDKKKNLIIMNPSIMGTALNIAEARISIFFDRNYDIKEYLQALGRNSRITSEQDVTTYILINDNTLENRLDSILEGKNDINIHLLNYDSLPKEKWKKIFEGSTSDEAISNS